MNPFFKLRDSSQIVLSIGHNPNLTSLNKLVVDIFSLVEWRPEVVGRATQPSDGSSLRPHLNLFYAVATGLAAILGAGIFSVNAPAAGIAGPALLVSFSIAASLAVV